MLKIPQLHYDTIINQISGALPNEACGILAGNELTGNKLYQIKNISKSPTSFQMDAIELLNALLDIEKNNLNLLAIYHSHPGGQPNLSSTDLNAITYPNAIQILFYRYDDSWQMRGFEIHKSGPAKIKIEIVTN